MGKRPYAGEVVSELEKEMAVLGWGSPLRRKDVPVETLMMRRRVGRGNRQVQKARSKKELHVFEEQKDRQDGWNRKSEGG